MSDGNSVPAKIRPTHLQRLALLYVRQSSPSQVRDHTGSAASQYDLKQLLLDWGWPDDRIKTLDADQGVSSTSGAKRIGIEELLGLIEARKVGIIMGRELSRLARTPPQIITILWAVKTTETLIWDQGGLKDPANESIGEFFGLQIKGLFGSVENETRTYAAMASKIAKARRGQPVTPAPIGYVRTSRGAWEKDPDPDVRDAVERVFTLYRRLGSLGKVVREMKRNGLKFPRRRRDDVRWRGLDAAHLHGILRNPAYCGDYVLSYKPLPGMEAPSADGRRTRQRVGKENVLDPYVDRNTWNAIQEMLAAQNPARRPMAGKGNALLQGLLRCPCGRLMRTQYWARHGQARTGTYTCRRIDEWGKNTHRMNCLARFVDHHVVHVALQALRPPALEHALAVVEETLAAEYGVSQTLRRQLEAAEHTVERAHTSYDRASDRYPRAKADLLRRYEAAVEERDRLREAVGAAGAVPRVTEQEADELQRLCRNVDDLWNAATTTNDDRKRILRSIIAEVVLQRADPDAIDVEIVWQGGHRETVRVLTPRGVDAFVRERSRAGEDAASIAGQLNAAGARTARGRAVSTNVIHQKQGHQGIRLKHERQRARTIIRQAVMENVRRPDIIERLNREAPRLGPWNPQRLSDEIGLLQRGVSGIERLPDMLPAELEQESVLAHIERGIAEGMTWTTMAKRLNELGLKPPRAVQFTPLQVRLQFLRIRGLKSFTLPRKPTRQETAGR